MELTLRSNGGPEERWTPAYLTEAAAEAHKFLNHQQYEHAVQQIRSLCEEADPTHPVLADVDAVDDFHELRDKGGVLGKTNLRIFFSVSRQYRAIVVLGVWKKEIEGPTPIRIARRIKWRKRRAEKLLGESRLANTSAPVKKRR